MKSGSARDEQGDVGDHSIRGNLLQMSGSGTPHKSSIASLSIALLRKGIIIIAAACAWGTAAWAPQVTKSLPQA